MAPLSEDHIATRIGKIQLWRGGSGEPVVYLHSATGEGPGVALLEALADDYEVLVPVFPGFGDSEGIDEIDDIEDAVYHLLDVFDVLGVTAPGVVGTSLGGWLAAEVASRYPERVGRLVLINPAGLHVEGAPIGEIFGRNPGELADDLFAGDSHPIAAMMHQLASLTEDKLAQVPFDLLRPTLQSLQATAKVAWNPYLHNPKLPKRLGRVTAPTLVLHGEADRLIPAAHAETYAALIPGARLVHAPGGAHLMVLEVPEVVTPLVREGLSGGA
jgi:pimeloyl-ACP methyl ester carboxylesterase